LASAVPKLIFHNWKFLASAVPKLIFHNWKFLASAVPKLIFYIDFYMVLCIMFFILVKSKQVTLFQRLV
jgi:hypothetical protein